ncbi:MAG: LysM-like peptidoglycan-binding domain-containing protein, partial [Pseudomonadales bacterium]|nr:LysM-like peptidoglycan-binding domain-containing protein [Pseudomonadales bacterium]
MARRLPASTAGRPAYPHRHLFVAALLGGLVAFALSVWPERDHRAHASLPAGSVDFVLGPAVPAVATGAEEAPAPEAEAPAPAAVVASPWATVTVRPGDSLARIFSREGLSPGDLQAVLDSDAAAKRLARIHPGEELRYRTDDAGRLVALHYAFSRVEAMVAQRPDGAASFETRLEQREPERRRAFREGEIDSSLFLAAARVGLDEGLAMELAGIFQWDVDFVLDIRR